MRYLIVRGCEAAVGVIRPLFFSEANGPTTEVVVRSPSGNRITVLLETPDAPAVAPRVPFDDNQDRLVWIDGFPLAREFDAFNVRRVELHRDRISELVGRFAFLRVDKRSGEVDIRTDPFGSCPVYLSNLEANDWAITNLPALAHRIARKGDLDHFGAAGTLCSPGPLGNHTLVTTVRILGHASQTTASPDRPPKTVTRDPLIPAGTKPSDLSAEDAATKFASQFGPIFTRLSDAGFDLRCALTGGRDSRAISALIASSIENPRYHFGGAAGAPESLIAGRAADALGGEFRLSSDPHNPNTDNFEASERHLLERDCGMVNYSFLRPPPAKVVDYNQHREVHLVGQAGEFARWSFESLFGLLFTPSIGASRKRLLERVANDGDSLFSVDSLRLVHDHINDRIQTARAEGVLRAHLQSVVVNQLKALRWAPMQLTRAAQRRDVFAPFLTLPFFELALRLSPRDRFRDAFHRELIRRCSPRALAVPFHGYSGVRQRLRNELARNLMISFPAIQRMYGRSKSPGRHARWEPWLRPILRDRLLSHDRFSPAWRFVRREALERILTDESGTLFRANVYPVLSAAPLIRFWDHYSCELSKPATTPRSFELKTFIPTQIQPSPGAGLLTAALVGSDPTTPNAPDPPFSDRS